MREEDGAEMLQRIHNLPFLFAFLLIATPALLFSGGAFYLSGGWKSKPKAETFSPGITIAGVDISGLTFTEAEAKLNSFLQTRAGGSLQVTIDGKSFPVLLKDINVKYDVPGSLLEARKASEERSGIWGMWKRWRGTAPSPELPLRVTFNREKLTDMITEIAKNVDRPAVPATAKVSETKITIVPEVEGYKVDVPQTVSAIDDELQRQSRHLRVPLVVEKDIPKITKETVKDIKVMLAEYSTTISPSVPNRLLNAEQAVRLINGTVLLPDQTFSFYQTAGPYTEGKGYLSVPILKDENVQDGVAGGAVQVASTLYIAAVKSGLPIIERHNNVRPVEFIPAGYDAFVRGKEFDLRFVNRMKQPIYIHAEIKNRQLRIAIFGAKPVPPVTIEAKEEEQIAPETIVRSDNTLPPRAEKIIRRGKAGLRVKVFVSCYKEDGSLKTELLSDDYYRPLHNIVAFGPAYEGMALETEQADKKNTAERQDTASSSAGEQKNKTEKPNGQNKEQSEQQGNVYILD